MPNRMLIPALVVLACCGGCTVLIPTTIIGVTNDTIHTETAPTVDQVPMGELVSLVMRGGEEVAGVVRLKEPEGGRITLELSPLAGTAGRLRTLPADSIASMWYQGPNEGALLVGVLLGITADVLVYHSMKDIGEGLD